MKQKLQMLGAALMLCATPLFAHDFEVDGIYYNIMSPEDKTVKVTFSGDSYYAIEEYSGSVTISETVTVKDAKGKETTKKVFKDGAKKLAARRKIMTLTHDIPDVKQAGEKNADYKARVKGIKHPLMEKLFNEIAPKYADRAEKLGQGGGYTRIYRLNNRRGDDAEMAIIELVD